MPPQFGTLKQAVREHQQPSAQQREWEWSAGYERAFRTFANEQEDHLPVNHGMMTNRLNLGENISGGVVLPFSTCSEKGRQSSNKHILHQN
jgi:hypothetical protein